MLAAQKLREWPESTSALRLLLFDGQPPAMASKKVGFCQAREVANSRHYPSRSFRMLSRSFRVFQAWSFSFFVGVRFFCRAAMILRKASMTSLSAMRTRCLSSCRLTSSFANLRGQVSRLSHLQSLSPPSSRLSLLTIPFHVLGLQVCMPLHTPTMRGSDLVPLMAEPKVSRKPSPPCCLGLKCLAHNPAAGVQSSRAELQHVYVCVCVLHMEARG